MKLNGSIKTDLFLMIAFLLCLLVFSVSSVTYQMGLRNKSIAEYQRGRAEVAQEVKLALLTVAWQPRPVVMPREVGLEAVILDGKLILVDTEVRKERFAALKVASAKDGQ